MSVVRRVTALAATRHPRRRRRSGRRPAQHRARPATARWPRSSPPTATGSTTTSGDFDITTEAVLAVLAAKPTSPVGVLTKGKVAVTAFVPTDQAIRCWSTT